MEEKRQEMLLFWIKPQETVLANDCVLLGHKYEQKFSKSLIKSKR